MLDLKMKPVKHNIVSCDSFYFTLIAGLRKLWEQNQLCDVVLKVQEREFSCHRNVLAANCKYFATLFTEDFKEKDKNLISLPADFEILPFQTLLEYFYSGKLLLSPENAEGVFRLSNYLRLDDLVELSAEFLEATLEKSNCVHRFEMAVSALLRFENLYVERLYKTAARLIVAEAAKEPVPANFLNLSCELMSKLLNSNRQLETAELLFLTVVKWVGHDEEKRQKFLSNLLQSIPVVGLSFEFFRTKIKTEVLLRRNLDGLQWLVDCVVPQFTTPISVIPHQPDSLFVASRDSIRKCYQLQISKPTTTPFCKRPNITEFSAVSYKRQVYLLCSYSNGGFFRLKESEKEWIEISKELDFGRYNAGTTVLDDDLFVIGGRANGNVAKIMQQQRINLTDIGNSCAKFNFVTWQRTALPDMGLKRDHPGVGVFGSSIYVTGGYGASIERFDPREGQWYVVGQRNSFLGQCSLTTVGYYLYSCDVKRGEVERFDVRRSRSEKLCNLPAEGKYYWITSFNDEIYAVQNNGCISKYNGNGDYWSDFHSGLSLCNPIILPWI